MELTTKDLEKFFSGKHRHAAFDEAVKKADQMRVHADGTFPKALIEERRPHESDAVLKYRQAIFQPITKPTITKVMNSLAKIRRSSEWSIRFDEQPPKRIAVGEDLATYINAKFPNQTSLTNWCFSVLLREYVIDANAWIVVAPEEKEVAENEYVRPRPSIFRADQIVDFGEGFLVVKSDRLSKYRDGSGVEKEGSVYYVITDETLQKWEQVSDKNDFEITYQFDHGLNRLPAFQMRGVVLRDSDQYRLSETRLFPMVPRLDEAIREYSDLQAEVVQHIHSEKWEIGQKECVSCHGSGLIDNAYDGSRYPCETCHGTGWEPRGPYTVLKVSPPMAGEASAPIPPMGYIQKDTNIVEVQDKRIEGHIFQALSAVNMEFLTQIPTNESGISKAYDADETNNFVHTVAEDLVAMLDSIVLLVNEYRYTLAVPNAEDRAKMLPVINVPDRFDLFSAAMLENELNNAKTRGVNPIILNTIELDYISKKFNGDPKVSAFISAIFKLDPLPNTTEENKSLMLMNGGITKQTYVLSCNIYAFVTRAVDEEGPEFFLMTFAEQTEIVRGYADEQIAASSTARQILSPVTAQ